MTTDPQEGFTLPPIDLALREFMAKWKAENDLLLVYMPLNTEVKGSAGLVAKGPDRAVQLLLMAIENLKVTYERHGDTLQTAFWTRTGKMIQRHYNFAQDIKTTTNAIQ